MIGFLSFLVGLLLGIIVMGVISFAALSSIGTEIIDQYETMKEDLEDEVESLKNSEE